MTDTSTKTLYAEAILGRDAEEFLQTDLGRYMLARAEEDEQQALDGLAKVWPWRTNRIRQLQAQLWRARSFKQWLGEMVMAGKQALSHLETPAE